MAGCTWLLRGWPLAQNRKKPVPCSTQRNPCCAIPRFWSRGAGMPSTPRVWLLHCTVLANGHVRSPCFTRCAFGSWANSDAFLWLRKRTNETGSGLHETDQTCCGKAAEEARPASIQTLAMRRVRSAGCLCKWHTLLVVLGNADTGKKLLHGAVTTSGGRSTSNLTKDGPKKQHKVKKNSHWTSNVLGTTVYEPARGAWLPKVKACKSWTEWRSLTKELERVWHAMLSLKPHELTTATWDAPVEREMRPRDDSDPWFVPW